MARLGDELDLFDLVTEQSAKAIRVVDGDEFTPSGKAWSRGKNERVKLVKLDWKISKVEIGSDDGKGGGWKPVRKKRGKKGRK